MSNLGLTLDDLGGGVEVWPDNLTAVNVFIALTTQWRTGFSGPSGLDYGVIPSVMRLCAVPRAEWPDVFHSVRLMESEALKVLREQRA